MRWDLNSSIFDGQRHATEFLLSAVPHLMLVHLITIIEENNLRIRSVCL